MRIAGDVEIKEVQGYYLRVDVGLLVVALVEAGSSILAVRTLRVRKDRVRFPAPRQVGGNPS